MTDQELFEMSVYCDLEFKRLPLFMVASSYDLSELKVERIRTKVKSRIKKDDETVNSYYVELRKADKHIKNLSAELEKKDRLLRNIARVNGIAEKRWMIEKTIEETNPETLCDDVVELKMAIGRLNRMLAETYRLTP